MLQRFPCASRRKPPRPWRCLVYLLLDDLSSSVDLLISVMFCILLELVILSNSAISTSNFASSGSSAVVTGSKLPLGNVPSNLIFISAPSVDTRQGKKDLALTPHPSAGIRLDNSSYVVQRTGGEHTYGLYHVISSIRFTERCILQAERHLIAFRI
jgi:hypothetical protein